MSIKPLFFLHDYTPRRKKQDSRIPVLSSYSLVFPSYSPGTPLVPSGTPLYSPRTSKFGSLAFSPLLYPHDRHIHDDISNEFKQNS